MSCHDRMMKAFQVYFRANQRWETTETHLAGIALRKSLNEFIRISKDYKNEIQAIRKQKPQLKSPKYRQAQKDKLKGDADAN